MERNLKNGIELMWTGKERAISEARKPATHILKHVHSGSMLGVKFNHLFIEGDNLEALKILQSNYLEKIHQIYIDPPYNTGQLFVYNDKFDNQEDWLNMMLPRLIIARQLLKDDGVIFVSIDDHELANLKILMDETFGKENYIEIFSWVKSETPANLARKSKKVVEYVLCYQKKNNKKKFKGIKKYSPSSNGLLNQSNKKGVLVFPANIVHTKIKDGIIKAGKYGTDRYDIDLLEDTIVQSGYFNKEIILQAKFKWTQSKLEREIQKGTKISIPTLRLSPSYDKTSYDPEVPPNLINHKVGVVTNEVASTNLTKLMGAKV
ncbi:MAG: site-specific DNA-methyltransferase, partial [Bacteroidia bacterium]|nr:site-specific DNA-methyltransferase [Bacteroidia bacterium]